jgi:hypothetical protein
VLETVGERRRVKWGCGMWVKTNEQAGSGVGSGPALQFQGPLGNQEERAHWSSIIYNTGNK